MLFAMVKGGAMTCRMIFREAKADELTSCFSIRRTVFIEEQLCPEEEEFDGLDSKAVHFLALIDDQPVGTARLRFMNDKVKFERLAVLRNYRNAGIGRGLLQYILDYIDGSGWNCTLIHAQAHLQQFYECFGFAREGEEFWEAGIRHYRMTRYW